MRPDLLIISLAEVAEVFKLDLYYYSIFIRLVDVIVCFCLLSVYRSNIY
jgi:hypothetical protein